MLKSILSFVFIFVVAQSFAQLTLQQKLQSNLDLPTQFQILLAQSRSQDVDFKIIRKSNIEIIQKNVADSIAKYTKEIASLKSNSSSSVNTLQAVRDSLSLIKEELHTEKQKTDNVSVAGLEFGKGAYHGTVWTLIAVLSIVLLTTVFSFRKAKVDAVVHQQTAEEVQNEFHTYKKKAMEKEQQLKRQLLDEQLKRNQ
ncbi:hypothetical protein ACL9RF_07815 [Sphingobacterium sp. Mn56C]|uniref:hypothetical protein n=1 Tax=Sphingobacterium sp. Mn56C TaxID=3395261 RepID=UPI003BBF9FCE